MHPSTYEYLKPTNRERIEMIVVRILPLRDLMAALHNCAGPRPTRIVASWVQIQKWAEDAGPTRIATEPQAQQTLRVMGVPVCVGAPDAGAELIWARML